MKPMLFSTPMILALLNTKPGTWPAEPIDPSKPCKSMTRRVINPQPRPERGGESEFDSSFWSWKKYECEDIEDMKYHAPYKVGDVLWVRESWAHDCKWNENPYRYRADYIGNTVRKWKPSIFMPREATCLFLEVKSVRVERLQDISEMDAKAEGVDRCFWFRPYGKTDGESILFHGGQEPYPDVTHKASFANLWESINAKRGFSWESNPWVFCYSFMRVEK
jgi:hypothetical protein